MARVLHEADDKTPMVGAGASVQQPFSYQQSYKGIVIRADPD